MSFVPRFHKCKRTSFHASFTILGDPGADSGGEGKSKWAEKYGTKKSKERREEPLGTMSYQTSSKRSPPFCLLIGQKNTTVFWHQSEVRMAATVWNWSGKTLSPGALLAVLYFSLCHIFHPFRLSLAPTICPWVSEEALSQAQPVKKHTKVFKKRSGARISGIQLSCRLQSLLNL